MARTGADADQLDRWVERGLITAEQAERIREDEARRAGEPGEAPRHGGLRPYLVAEGLGHVGGVLVLVAAVTISGRYWSELGTGGRLALVLGAAALLLVSGAAVTAEAGSAGYRLRAVSWALAVAATGGALALIADELPALGEETVATVAAAGAAVLAVLLWRRHRTAVQQATFVGAVALAVAAATAHLPSTDEALLGLALWGWGSAWLLLGWGRIVDGRATADVCGGVVAVIGTVFAAYTVAGSVLAVATAVVLVAIGVRTGDLVLLAVGSAATLVTVPVVMGHWFPDTLVAPFALFAVGVLLVGGALWTARSRAGGARTGAVGDRALDPRVAVAAAVVVALAVTVTVVVLGLR